MSKVREMTDGTRDERGLTARQRKVLEVIRDSVQRRGYPPSMREIGESVGLTSTSSVSHQLRALQSKGFLLRDPNRPRAVVVRMPGSAAAQSEPESYETASGQEPAARPAPAYVPLVGRIAAGGPIIADGDWVDKRQQPVTENGDNVAAMIDNKTTKKTFKRRDDRVWLMPHNPA